MLWQVSVKYHSVEKFIHHVISPGNAVTNCGRSPPRRIIQIVSTRADLPEGPLKVPRISYFWPYGLCFPSSALVETARSRRSFSRRRQLALV
jgi:hypothetical protein